MNATYVKRFIIGFGVFWIGITMCFGMVTKVCAAAEIREAEASKAASDYDERQGLVQVHLVYVDENNQSHILKQGCGFFIGDIESGEYVLTNYNTVMLSEEEKNAYISQFALESGTLNTQIQVLLRKDVRMEFSYMNGSQSMDLAILAPGDSLGSVTNLWLSEAEYYEKGSSVHTLGFADIGGGNTEVVQEEGILEDWTVRNDTHCLRHTAVINENNRGGPLLNEEGEVIGLNVASAEGGYYSIQISEVIELLKALGITYNSEPEVNTAALEETLAVYEEQSLEEYTEETVELCEACYEEAEELLMQVEQGEITPYTQEEIDALNEALLAAMDGLEQKEMSTRQVIIIAGILVGVLLIAIVVLIVMLQVRRKKYIEELEKQKHMTPSERLGIQERIRPEAASGRLRTYLPVNRTLSEIHIRDSAEQDVHETTVLNTDTTEEPIQKDHVLPACPVLIRLKTGDVIQIVKNSFLIGKSSEQADYYVSGNTSISRTHVCIKRMSDGYYIQDLKTTNGTYVDGIKVSWDRDVKLRNGCIIKMADEEFEFKL